MKKDFNNGLHKKVESSLEHDNITLATAYQLQ